MSAAVRQFDLEAFDLILVDDSTNAADRAATIRALSASHPSNPWLVIHDYEVEEYRAASSAFKQRFAFKAYNPHTGLISNCGLTSAVKLLDLQIKYNSSALQPDDAESWRRILRGFAQTGPCDSFGD